jgi:hypothetical protein
MMMLSSLTFTTLLALWHHVSSANSFTSTSPASWKHSGFHAIEEEEGCAHKRK